MRAKDHGHLLQARHLTGEVMTISAFFNRTSAHKLAIFAAKPANRAFEHQCSVHISATGIGLL
ncbi:MAG: hypothetical protein Rhims3KO_14580 [Hyphomicrobiales bacterium]